jgi:hypothetical protein
MAYQVQTLDVLEARIITFDPTAPSQVGINVMHWQVTSTVGVGVSQQLIAAALDTRIAALYKNLISSSVTYRGVIIQKVWPLPRVVAEFSVASTSGGSTAATQAPTQVAGLVSFRTAKAGRAFRGRMYLPFLGSGSIDAGGNATAPYVTALQAFATALIPALTVTSAGNSNTMTPQIYHPRGYGAPPVNLHSVDTIVSATASPLLATIRRRGNYGRSNSSSPI